MSLILFKGGGRGPEGSIFVSVDIIFQKFYQLLVQIALDHYITLSLIKLALRGWFPPIYYKMYTIRWNKLFLDNITSTLKHEI